MSELKAISGHEIREDIDYNTRGIDPEDKEWRKYGKELCDTLYYRKSEADKVITNLEEKHKTEVKELLCLIRDKENNFNRAFDSEEKEIRHQKYRRCLLRSVIAEMNAVHFKDLFYDAGSEVLADEYNKQITIHYKWQKRWLKLAEKFKPNNSTAQRAKELKND